MFHYSLTLQMRRIRKLIFYEDHYWEFFDSQSEKVKDKIDSVLFLIAVAVRIPKMFFNKIIDHEGLYEISIDFESNIYRIICCFDEGSLIILFNGFQKKTKSTPRKEIEKALKIKDEYFERKRKGA